MIAELNREDRLQTQIDRCVDRGTQARDELIGARAIALALFRHPR
jgi:hypothetical protein